MSDTVTITRAEHETYQAAMQEVAELRRTILEISMLTFNVYEDGRVELKPCDLEQFDKASKMCLECCKKWLI